MRGLLSSWGVTPACRKSRLGLDMCWGVPRLPLLLWGPLDGGPVISASASCQEISCMKEKLDTGLAME